MTDKIRPNVMFKAMRHKVFTLLKTESKLSLLERKNQQWQLLFQIKGYGSYVLGKGGINTMFYTIDDGERKLCYPDDLLALIDTWIEESDKTGFGILNSSGKLIRNVATQKEALDFKAKVGAHIVRIADGTQTRLFVRVEGLFNKSWKPLIK